MSDIPPGSSSSSTTTTLTNSQMSNLYWCQLCENAVRIITAPRIQCPRCNSRYITQLRNPEFDYTWSDDVDVIRPPRLPPLPIPRRYNYDISSSRSGSAITSLLFRPRPQRPLLQSLDSNQETDSAAPSIPPRAGPTRREVERLAESSSTNIILCTTTDPAIAVTRSPTHFSIPPGFNPSNFIRGPEMNVISSMMIDGTVAEPQPQQLQYLQAPPAEQLVPPQSQHVPQLEAPPEQPTAPQSPQVPQLDQVPPVQPTPQSPLAQPLEAPAGPSSLPSTEPAVMPDSLVTVIVKPEDVEELNLSSFCGACLEDFEVGETVTELPRGPRFHRDCNILHWLFPNAGSCPVSSMIINGTVANEQAETQPPQLPNLQGPAAEQPVTPQSQQVPQLEAQQELPAAPQSPLVSQLDHVPPVQTAPAQSLEEVAGPSSLPSTEPAVIPDSLATVIVKPEHVKEVNYLSFCGLCLEDFEVGEYVTELPCGHRFHCNCILRWLFSNDGSCPVCGTELPPRDGFYVDGDEQGTDIQ